MTERLLSKHGKYLRKYHSQEGAYNENGDRPKWGFQECLDNVESSCSQVGCYVDLFSFVFSDAWGGLVGLFFVFAFCLF